MATLDWSPSLFEGQSWSTWEEEVPLSQGEESTDGPEKEKADPNIMRLRKNDMQLFGICPSRDDCYLVVCEKCGQIIKPQTLKYHMEQRHSGTKKRTLSEKEALSITRTMGSKPVINITKTTLASLTNPTVSVPKTSSVATPSRTSNAQEKVLSKPTASAAGALDLPKRNTPSPKTSSNNNNASSVNAQKQNTAKLSRLKTQQSQPVLNIEKVRVPSSKLAAPLTQSKPPSGSPKCVSATPPAHVVAHHPSLGVNGIDASPPHKLPKQIPCKDREFSADVHCGVLAKDTGEQCTRSLTCKRHLLSLRRGVAGRSKPFDQLLSEHRKKKDIQKQFKLQQAAIQAAKQLGQSQGFTVSKTPPSSTATVKPPGNAVTSVKAVNRVIHSPFYRSNSQSSEQVASSSNSKPLPSPTIQPSSSWNMADEPLIPDTSPSPAAVCTFGARYKCNTLLFNRKMDLLSSAFRDCTERYLHPPPFKNFNDRYMHLPPHKKVCVEGRRKDLTSSHSRDTFDPGYHDNNGNSLSAQSKSFSNSKSKSAAAMRAIKPKDLMSKPNSSPSSGSSNKANNVHKRKKNPSGNIPTSGSIAVNVSNANHMGAVATTSVPLAIPLQGAVLSNKNCQQNKINLRDINLLVTGVDPSLGPLINLNASGLMNADLGQNTLNIVQLQPIFTTDNLSASFTGNGATTGLGKVSTNAVQSGSVTNALFRSGTSPQVSTSLPNGIIASHRNHSTGSRTPSPATDLSNSGQFSVLAGKPGKAVQQRAENKSPFQANILNTGRILTSASYQQMAPLMHQIQIQGSSIKTDGGAGGTGAIRHYPISIPIMQQDGSQQVSSKTFYASSGEDTLKQHDTTSNAVS